MKYVLTLLLGTLFCFSVHAETIKLKITYYDSPVQSCDITIKHGDVPVGAGRTDSDGEVRISGNLMSKSIDVYGEKQTKNSSKKWDLKGYVQLDDDNFAHLKMEVYAKEMAEFSGMSESLIASAWGLTLAGDNTASSASTKSADNPTPSDDVSSTSSNDGDSETASLSFEVLKEERLLQKRKGLENQLVNLNRKIEKNQANIADLSSEKPVDAIKLQREQIELQRNELKREKVEIELQETDAELDGPALNREQRLANKERKEDIKDRLKTLKVEDQDLKDEQSLETTSKTQVQKKRAELSVKLKKEKLNLKLKRNKWSQKKIEEQEQRIEELETQLEKYNQRLEELKKEKK